MFFVAWKGRACLKTWLEMAESRWKIRKSCVCLHNMWKLNLFMWVGVVCWRVKQSVESYVTMLQIRMNQNPHINYKLNYQKPLIFSFSWSNRVDSDPSCKILHTFNVFLVVFLYNLYKYINCIYFLFFFPTWIADI